MMTVGQIIRARREALGLTLTALAEQVGATKSYLSMIENHRVPNPPSLALLRELERSLGIGGGELERAADWQNTPEQVKRELEAAVRSRAEGQALALQLKQMIRQRKGERNKLDQMLASGELQTLIEQVLESGGDGGAAAAEEKGTGIERRPGAGDVASTGRGDGGVADADGARGVRRGGDGSIDAAVGVRYRVPIINKVAAGYPRDFTDLDYPTQVADEYIDCPDMTDTQAFAARVVGESMAPAYREGDVVVFSPAAEVTSGSDCFVRLEPDHESTFKRVYFEDDGERIRLQPLNPRYPIRVVGREQVAGMYRAVWRYQRL